MKKFLQVNLGILIILMLTGCPGANISPCEITSFNFSAALNNDLSTDVIASINGTNISATVPYKTDVTALVASFTISGIRVTVGGITQVSGSLANDYTNPVTWVVTAEDSTTQAYIVTVNISAAAIENSNFGSASIPGDSAVLSFGGSSETLTMMLANNSDSMTFPTGTDDVGTATLTTTFFMGETEVTNAVMATVLQWAYENGKFSSTIDDPNGLDTSAAKHGAQLLLDIADGNCMVDYDGSGTFSAGTGYENNPVTNVTWYGAVMFCNWLTEMRDKNTNNVVYTGIDTTWVDDETIEDTVKTGYRLPTGNEWEYTARYRGAALDNTVTGFTDPYFTKGDSASNAVASVSDANACRAVAVYFETIPQPTDEAEVKSLGAGSANSLGLYDMSGNVAEWCFTWIDIVGTPNYLLMGGGWSHFSDNLSIGERISNLGLPADEYDYGGFRLCRTAY